MSEAIVSYAANKSIDVIKQGDRLVVDSRLIADDLGIDLKIFSSVCVSTFNEVPEYLSAFDLLVIWQRSDYLGFDIKCYIEQIKSLFYPHWDEKEKNTFDWLACAVVSDVSNNIISRSCEVGKTHKWFKENHGVAIPGSKLIPVVAKNKKRPDFLVEIQGCVYPVECKLKFGTPALSQLKGYMKLWNVHQGFAVATQFIIGLPANITAIHCPQ